MKERNQILAGKPSAASSGLPEIIRSLPPRLVLASAALVVCFGVPLYTWGRFALQSELFSYTLLIPFISLYLFVQNRKRLNGSSIATHRSIPVLLIASALTLLACFWFAILVGKKLNLQDSVALTTTSFVLALAGVCAWWLNVVELKQAAFPLAFLLFMTPFPVGMEHSVESFLQHGSAPPAYWLLRLVGTPVYRHGLVFELPGIMLQIAPECSGIRSTIVLFITSLLAGYLFLRSPWKRAALTAVVLPLALLRNGFRIFTIGQLCVHFGPHMIDSPIHHRGGPIFFALSLIPFSLMLFVLVRSDRSFAKTNQSGS